MKKKLNVKWCVYLLDTYAFNYYTKNKKRAYSEEKELLKSCDLAIVTDLIYKDYEDNSLVSFLHKVKTLEFPNIQEISYNESIKSVCIDRNKINCAFIGSLYPEIRNPEFLFNIISSIDNDKIKHTIAGKIYGTKEAVGINEEIEKKIDFLGQVDIKLAVNLMLDADILINIGNTVPNQMPSKIFDYISTGKPIINVCKIRNCPTLKYLEKYPLCLNIFEEDGMNKDVTNKFEAFCIENKGKMVSYETIERIYHDCTCDAVANKFVKYLEGY